MMIIEFLPLRVYNGAISGLFGSFYGKNVVKKGEKQGFFIVFDDFFG